MPINEPQDPPDYKPELNEDALESVEEPTAADSKESPPEHEGSEGLSVFGKFKLWYSNHKKLAIPLTIVSALVVLGGIPWTRYHLAGLAYKKNFTIEVKDATTNAPVSGANVRTGSLSVQTDANGKAVMRLPVGPHKFSFSKKYYLGGAASATVPILKQKSVPTIALTATGRQVRVSVTNLIDKKTLSNVEIIIADIKAKTDKTGTALLVLPAGLDKMDGLLKLSGYNDKKISVKINAQQIEDNKYALTPSAKVYFLSKLSGKIDLMKTDLDGGGRTTVLAGTGQEEDENTVLLASRDWKYLALLSRRSGSLAKLYVINTNNDQLLTMDEGNATFSPIGWYDHYFIYKVSRNGYTNWQPNAVSIKSYDAETGKLISLVNSNATGSSNDDAQYENIWDTKILGSDLIYTRTWYKYPGYLDVEGKQNVLAAIRPDGSNSRTIKSVDAGTSYFTNLNLVKPAQLHYQVSSNNSNEVANYSLDTKGKVTSIADSGPLSLTTYLVSPSDKLTFWSEERDGKNSLFVGDENSGDAKQVAALSDFSPYGWSSDNYLLVSKNRSELYAIPAKGINKDSQAVKITDYHKPAEIFYGYGGI